MTHLIVTQNLPPFARPPYGDLAQRTDVIVFETAPFEADLEITGTPEVEL